MWTKVEDVRNYEHSLLTLGLVPSIETFTRLCGLPATRLQFCSLLLLTLDVSYSKNKKWDSLAENQILELFFPLHFHMISCSEGIHYGGNCGTKNPYWIWNLKASSWNLVCSLNGHGILGIYSWSGGCLNHFFYWYTNWCTTRWINLKKCTLSKRSQKQRIQTLWHKV